VFEIRWNSHAQPSGMAQTVWISRLYGNTSRTCVTCSAIETKSDRDSCVTHKE